MCVLIMQKQFYVYFNRVGDVFTMIALSGGLFASTCLFVTHILQRPSREGEKLLLLIYGILNTVIGLLLLLENWYYCMSRSYLLLAILTKISGLIMLADFARNQACENKSTQYSRHGLHCK